MATDPDSQLRDRLAPQDREQVWAGCLDAQMADDMTRLLADLRRELELRDRVVREAVSYWGSVQHADVPKSPQDMFDACASYWKDYVR